MKAILRMHVIIRLPVTIVRITETRGLSDLILGSTNTLTGTVQRTALVMTSSSNGNAFYGVLFNEGDEWIRVYTTDSHGQHPSHFFSLVSQSVLKRRGSLKKKITPGTGLSESV